MSKVGQTNLEIIDIFKKQIDIENKTLNKLVNLEEDARETAVRLSFMNLRLDTWKHIKFLEGMIELLNTTPCDEWSAKVGRYAGRVKLERELDYLKKDEDDMIQLLKSAISRVRDPIGKLLLEHMKEEEKHHFNDLGKLVKLIQSAPLQSKKGEKGTDIVCDTE